MVVLQAKDAWSLAPELCAPTGCAWYHRVWPTLRLLGLVATPYRHESFFADALRAAAPRRLLVSGAADAAMVEIARAAAPAAAVTVLDRCATPVAVASAWATRAGTEVDGWVADVLEHAGREDAFDAVCTHGLFGLVADADRLALARRWASLLRPGGVLVTTTSLAGAEAPDPSTFTADAVEGFVQRAGAAAAAAELPAPVDEVVAAARAWAEGAHVHPVRSVEAVVVVLDAAGFDVAVELRDVAGPLGRDDGGPTSARAARYLEIVATRR